MFWLSSSCPTRAVHFVTLMVFCRHVSITQSQQFTSGFILGVVHPAGLDNCIVTCTHHYSIIRSGLTTLTIFCALPIHPSSLLTLGNHWPFYSIVCFPECHRWERKPSRYLREELSRQREQQVRGPRGGKEKGWKMRSEAAGAEAAHSSLEGQ